MGPARLGETANSGVADILRRRGQATAAESRLPAVDGERGGCTTPPDWFTAPPLTVTAPAKVTLPLRPNVPSRSLISVSWPDVFCMTPANVLEASPLPTVRTPLPDKLSIVPVPLRARR